MAKSKIGNKKNIELAGENTGSFLIPKLISPRSAHLYSRLKLFELIDRSRELHSQIWISAPAGAGKTSLAISYIEANTLPTMWYQVDAGDSEIASFFYYLGLAIARIAPQYEQSMPVLKAEYIADLPTFAQYYFRELGRRLPHNCIFVLDNFQNMLPDSSLYELLPMLIQELRHDLTLIVLSREEPPATLARLRIGGELTCLDSTQLLLSYEECYGVCAKRLGEEQPDPTMLIKLHEHSQGWAAGLVLLLEQARASHVSYTTPTLTTRVLLFDYFAGEIFSRFTESEQQFLLKTALFPQITAPAACVLSGNNRAEAILSDLARRNYFTVGHADNYEYHPLFRDYLLNRLISETDLDSLKEMQKVAAHLLFEQGQTDDAVGLLLAAGAWEALSLIILNQAESLFSQGRVQVLARWIRSIPESQREQEPWLDYWLGVSCIDHNSSEARLNLERAHHLFLQKKDRTGLLLSWSVIAENLTRQFDDISQVYNWVEWLNQELLINPDIPSAAIELRVIAGMTAALLSSCEDDHEIARWIEKASAALYDISDLGTRSRMATYISIYATWTGDMGRLPIVAEQTQQWSEILLSQGRDGIEVQNALYCKAMYFCTAGIHDFGREASEQALAHATQTGIHVITQFHLTRAFSACMCQGDVESASMYLGRLMSLGGYGQPSQKHNFRWHNFPGWLSLGLGNPQKALNEALESLRIIESSFGVISQRVSSHLVAGHALALLQRREEAVLHIEQVLDYAQRFKSPMMEFSALLLQGFIERDDKGNHTALRRALTIGRVQHYLNTIVWLPSAVTEVCCLALENGIEETYVQNLIMNRHLEPVEPPINLENWPWPLRLYTLGRFSIVRDGCPLVIVTGKGQKKPLEMLQTLIALGGRQVGVAHIIEQLWPDAEGDAGANLFKITLHRLRKLLGYEHSIESAEGRVSINPKLVWVDCWAWSRIISKIYDNNYSDRALTLYHDHFLSLESANNSAIVHYREQLRSRMLEALKTHIKHLEKQKNWDLALDLCTKAINLDDINEDFYSAAIRAHLALGRKAEALRIFEKAKNCYAQFSLSPSQRLKSIIEDS